VEEAGGRRKEAGGGAAGGRQLSVKWRHVYLVVNP